MVDNQHQKIKGYRDLSEREIGLINDVKRLGEQVGADRLLGKYAGHRRAMARNRQN